MPKADDILKWVVVVPIIAPIVGGTVAFFVQRGDEMARLELVARTNELEAKKVFLTKQFELYVKAVEIASRLATKSETKQDVTELWQLYWGQLGMVEDGRVSEAMTLVRRTYGAAVAAKNHSGTTAGDSASRCGNKLQDASLTLSHCMRKSLEESWKVRFQPGTNNLCTDEQFDTLSLYCPEEPSGWKYQFQGYK